MNQWVTPFTKVTYTFSGAFACMPDNTSSFKAAHLTATLLILSCIKESLSSLASSFLSLSSPSCFCFNHENIFFLENGCNSDIRNFAGFMLGHINLLCIHVIESVRTQTGCRKFWLE